jgi:hypothetical protein
LIEGISFVNLLVFIGCAMRYRYKNVWWLYLLTVSLLVISDSILMKATHCIDYTWYISCPSSGKRIGSCISFAISPIVYMKKSGQNLSQMGTTIVIPICYLFILQASWYSFKSDPKSHLYWILWAVRFSADSPLMNRSILFF